MPLLLDYPLEVRTPFGVEGLERLARAAGFGPASQLAQVGAGEGGLHLASRLGCRVLVVDESAEVLGQLAEQVSARGLASKVELRTLPMSAAVPEALPLPDSTYDGVLTELRLAWPLAQAMAGLRSLLVPSGRLMILYPVQLEGKGSAAALYWEKRLGGVLPTPIAFLDTLTRAGFESLTGEVLSPAELAAFYGGAEGEEARAMLDAGGKISWMQVLGRRRESGEKPPVSRRGDR